MSCFYSPIAACAIDASGIFYLFGERNEVKSSQVKSSQVKSSQVKSSSIALPLILASLFLVYFSSANAALNDGLVAYWSFDNCSAKDDSGNGNNGTINGNLNCIAGINNKALQFDGQSHIRVPNAVSLNPTTQLTMSFWIRADNFINAWSGIISKGAIVYSDCRDDREYSVWIANDSTFYQDSAGDGNCLRNIISKKVITDKWLHYVGVIDRVNHVMSIYINGVLNTQQTDNYSSFNINNYDLQIGSSAVIQTQSLISPFKGALDELRIYNRALTDSEVTALYQQGATTSKTGVSSNTNICATYPDWCAHPTFEVLGMSSNSDIPINLINTSYIVDGMTRTVNGGKAIITANLYNRGYADAMLDIYDKQGNWTGFISLSGNRPETTITGDIWDKWTTTYDTFFTDEYSSFDPRGVGSSERLKVNFSITQGGYAVLSKNSRTAIANTVLNNALAIFGEREWLNEQAKTNKMKLLKIVINEVVNQHLEALVSQLKAAVEKNDQVEAENLTRQILEKVSSISYTVFFNNSKTVMKVFGNYKAQAFVKKAAKFFSPLGKLAEAAETAAMSLSITGQLIDIAKANNDRAVYFK